MREIKYRVYDKADKMMYYNIEKGIKFDDGSIYHFENFLGIQKVGDYHDWELMQYIGQKDKAGRETYEEDIIMGRIIRLNGTLEFLGKIKYNTKSAMYVLQYNSKNNYGLEMKLAELHEFEILGNTYENLELLEATQ